MRVISGKYKGKKLQGFDIEGTRPTMDRVKESMFAQIQSYIKDAIVLDLFAGSGALGIEALSNGASICYFVDHNPKAIQILQKNIEMVENAILLKQDFLQALTYFKNKHIQFSLILLDPPYHENFLNQALEKIIDFDLLLPNGIIVCEYEQGEVICPFKVIKEKQYGEKKITVFLK